MLHLANSSPEPLHQQISRQLRARILSGEMVTGLALPSIRGMARDHEVSVITVRRAYDDLLREGLLSARQGKGYFVQALSHSQKRNMARERLHQQIGPMVAAALAEGISATRIRRAVARSLADQRSQ